MRVVTSEEMRELDRRAIQDCGMPGVVLMENAAAAVVLAVETACSGLQGKRVVVISAGPVTTAEMGTLLHGACRCKAALTVFTLASEVWAYYRRCAKPIYTALKHSGVPITAFTKLTDFVTIVVTVMSVAYGL